MLNEQNRILLLKFEKFLFTHPEIFETERGIIKERWILKNFEQHLSYMLHRFSKDIFD